jgi:ribosome-associated protein
MAISKTQSKPKATKKTVRKKDVDTLLKDAVVEGMQEKKGKDIVVIDLRPINSAIADYFVICHADSGTQIEAIARSVEEIVYKQTGDDALHVEGKQNGEWVLLDYSSVVAHVFRQDKREFYGLERLWADAEIERIASNY